jgi:predicted esterase
MAGTSLDRARAAVIMIHGRGASARDILGLAAELAVEDVAWLAPEAAGQTWYPFSFMEPMERNEPHLSSALATVDALVNQVVEAGIERERIVLVGFSQGACLSSEYMARIARRFGGLAALSGGLIGPPGTPRDYDGSLSETPVFLGCSDVDPHIPLARVEESAEVFRNLGASVDARIYPGMGHTVNRDELAAVRALVEQAKGA